MMKSSFCFKAILRYLLFLPILTESLNVYLTFEGSPDLLDGPQIVRIEELLAEAYNQDDLVTGSAQFSSSKKTISAVEVSAQVADRLTNLGGGGTGTTGTGAITQPFTLLAKVTCKACTDGLLFSTKESRSFFAYSTQDGLNGKTFVFRFNDLLLSTTQTPAIVSLKSISQIESIAECPLATGTGTNILEATLVLNTLANVTLIDDAQIAVLEQGLLDSFNFLNTVSTDPNRCDDLYRRVVQVTLSIPELQDQSPARGRNLASSSSSRPALNVPKGRKLLPLIYKVRFNCPDCPKNALLINDPIKRRRTLSVASTENEDPVKQLQPRPQPTKLPNANGKNKTGIRKPRNPNFVAGAANHHRALQITNTNGCICPVNPTIFGPPTRQELFDTYAQFVDIAFLLGAVTFLEQVDNAFVEVEQVDCPGDFVGTVQDIVVDLIGDPNGLSEDYLQRSERAFVSAYNALADNGCDPLFRILTDAVVLSTRVDVPSKQRGLHEVEIPFEREPTTGHRRLATFPRLGIQGKPYRLVIRSTGRCKNCPSGTKNFSNDAGRRKRERDLKEETGMTFFHPDLGSNYDKSLSSHRFLQVINDIQCFCDVSPRRLDAPRLEDFVPVYEDFLVNVEQIPAVSAVVDARDTEAPNVDPPTVDARYLQGIIRSFLPTADFTNPNSASSKAIDFLVKDGVYSATLSNQRLAERFGAAAFWISTTQCGADVRVDGWLQVGVDTCDWGGTTIVCSEDGLVSGIFLGNVSPGESDLCGSIPLEMFLMKTMTTLHLQQNKMTGNIPSQLATLINLEELRLNDNDFRGDLPTFLSKLVNLKTLLIYGNSALGGKIPTEFGNLVQMESLHMARCGLRGPLPSELGNMSKLQSFIVERNKITGLIPSTFANFLQLEEMLLNDNNLSTESVVPDILCEVANRIFVDLGGGIMCSCCQCCYVAS